MRSKKYFRIERREEKKQSQNEKRNKKVVQHVPIIALSAISLRASLTIKCCMSLGTSTQLTSQWLGIHPFMVKVMQSFDKI